MVVMSHRGVVEYGGHLWAPGVLDQQFSRFRICVDGICNGAMLVCNPRTCISSGIRNDLGSALSAARRMKLTLCKKIQLVNQKGLVLCPSEIEGLR